MTVTSEPPELRAVPVEQRSLPTPIVLVGVGLVALFLALVASTVVAVLADDTPEAPALGQLPLPPDVEVVDAMPTCTDQACDGHGVVVAGPPENGVALRLASAWRQAGYETIDCLGEGTLCVAHGDLRIEMVVWRDVDPLRIPSLVESVERADIEPARLAFVHFYRCGSNHACE